ncbi:MAG: D-glycero-beta-D-manno-heptose 1-phosphate adenylyltransferase [Candidatus Melainabacteria bacterium]|nr:MAG: D-glycero-beta-D-manno-heptose 1-phosphate adenylyltransferase [Candidatus Melainabacteria bacterium]
MGQILTKNVLIEVINDLKENNVKIAATNGCFDILHVGHVKYLKEAKKCGDVLVVGLNSDVSVKMLKGETRPINPQSDRAQVLAALNCVDYVVIFDEISPIELLKSIKPDVYVKGADYTLETLPEAKPLLTLGIDIKFVDLVLGKSTSNIIKKSQNN